MGMCSGRHRSKAPIPKADASRAPVRKPQAPPKPDSQAASAPETRFRSRNQTTHVIATASCLPNELTQPASCPPAGAGQPVGIVIHYTRLVATGCFVLRLAYSDNCYNVIFPPTRLDFKAAMDELDACMGEELGDVNQENGEFD